MLEGPGNTFSLGALYLAPCILSWLRRGRCPHVRLLLLVTPRAAVLQACRCWSLIGFKFGGLGAMPVGPNAEPSLPARRDVSTWESWAAQVPGSLPRFRLGGPHHKASTRSAHHQGLLPVGRFAPPRECAP